MSRLGLMLVLLLATGARAGDAVSLDSGEISGSATKDGVRVFKGIPFAAPPVGDLRWKPPQPVARWEGVRACTELGPACPQPTIPLFTVDERQSEDCLYLNVWTTAKDRDAKLPVMVWIHGGSYLFGSGGQPIYDGAALARRGVVLVTINYRLGAFGFLAHPALSKESGRDSSGDYGLLDQIAALEWVKRNVAAFGGDPGCVTIFGESAGGGSVTALLTSPLAKGLFHRAIVESGVCVPRHLHEPAHGMEAAEKTGERLAEKLGCAGAEDVLAALRKKSAKELLSATAASMNPFGEGQLSFSPVVDGWVLPDEPLSLATAGKQADVPLLIGTNADEASIFIVTQPRTLETLHAFVKSLYGDRSERVLAQYPAAKDEDAHRALGALVGDLYFIEPTRAFVRARPGLSSKAWLYHFTRVSPGAKLFGLGAHHAAELRYVFDTLDAPGPSSFVDADRKLAATMSATWVRFAKTGDPNGEPLPEWPAYSKANDAHLELGDRLQVGSGLRRAECDLLESLSLPKKKAKRYY